MKRSALLFWVSVGVLIILTTACQATRIIYQSPKDLARESSQIVRGRVSNVRTFWNAEKTKIFTEATIAVDEAYKGPAVAEVRVLQLGGIAGHVNMHVEGALLWTPREEVLLFLEPAVGGAFNVAGFSQGKFRIERDSRTGRAFVTAPRLEEVELVGKPASTSTPPKRVSLDQFINETVGRK